MSDDQHALTAAHAKSMAAAIADLIGPPVAGTIAFARCLSRAHIDALLARPEFGVDGWDVAAVTDRLEPPRYLTGDRAVEVREEKAERPTLFLVDLATAGAGLDGIYNAGRELHEDELLRAASGEAYGLVKRGWTSFVRAAVKKARRPGMRRSVTPWAEFDYAARASLGPNEIGVATAGLGLWPVLIEAAAKPPSADDVWTSSALLADTLLGDQSASPRARVERCRFDNDEATQAAVEAFVRSVAAMPPSEALRLAAVRPELLLGNLRPQFSSEGLRGISVKPWVSEKTKKLAKWSGLSEREDSIPQFLIDPDGDGKDKRLEVQWATEPPDLPAGAVEYLVRVVAGEDVLAERRVTHTAKPEQKARFSNEDFGELDEEQRFEARVEVSAVGAEVPAQATGDFLLAFGGVAPDAPSDTGAGKVVRCAMEGAVTLDRDPFDEQKSRWYGPGRATYYKQDKRGHVTFRPATTGRAFRVVRSPMLQRIEAMWAASADRVGRWAVAVRGDGVPADEPTFIEMPVAAGATADRVAKEARRFLGPAFAAPGGLTGEVYTDAHGPAAEYLLAWEKLYEAVDAGTAAAIALAHTLEVRSQSGRTLGLIVLPSHPVRVAWQLAYDRLLQHARYGEDMSPVAAVRELSSLDGSQFPACLPGLARGQTFVFADMLGFHAAAMVSHDEPEPKSAVSRLATCYGGGAAELAPAVAEQAGDLLSRELDKFVTFNGVRESLHVHAIRPGDGRTVARALGGVLDSAARRRASATAASDAETEGTGDATADEDALTFELQLYPSTSTLRSGRFFNDVLERRRAGTGGIDARDRWMIDSVTRPGGVTIPRLRWARRASGSPEEAAHVAVAFDTFDARVEASPLNALGGERPAHAFGLLARSERRCDLTAQVPTWSAFLPATVKGDPHPAGAVISRRLQQLHAAVLRAAGGNVAADGHDPADAWPVVRTRLADDRREGLRQLHTLADWVVTIDRNVGIEYFDAPREIGDAYRTYVIDCVPERDDLGNMQLVTSTARTDEVGRLLDGALSRMGLSPSERNVEFLLSQLKSLSGRLAMRLTNPAASNGELIALALAHAGCTATPPGAGKRGDDGWLPASNGFFVPLDDVRDLDPAINRGRQGDAPSPPSGSQGGNGRAEDDAVRRADLLFVAPLGRSGLTLQFVEVKYRQHLNMAVSPALLADAAAQARETALRWRQHYFGDKVNPVERAIRASRLAAALRFYADKARRHRLSEAAHGRLVTEIDRIVGSGLPDPVMAGGNNRVYVFCPEFGDDRAKALPLSDDGACDAYVFGPARLPETVAGWTASARPDGERAEVNTTVSDKERPAAQAAFVSGDNADIAGAAEVEPMAEAVSPAETDDAVPIDPPAPPTGSGDAVEVRFGTKVVGDDVVRWPVSVRSNPHLLVVGLPGMGKTECLVNACRQFAHAGVTPIVFSYHQDFDERIIRRPDTPLAGARLLRPDQLGFNPLRIEHPGPNAHVDAAGMMRDIFAGIFPELGDIQLSKVRLAVKGAYEALGWPAKATDESAVEAIDAPPFRAFYERLRREDKPDAGLLARLAELDDYGVFAGAGEQGQRLLESDVPAVLQIHVNQNEVIQRAFASLLLYGLYKDMFRRGPQSRITHVVIFDEAHRASRLKLIPTMAKECRKYGIALVLASQEAKDFDESLYSAVANYLALRVTENDAKAIARHCVAGDQKGPTADRLKALPKYEALFFREGAGRPSHIRLDPA